MSGVQPGGCHHCTGSESCKVTMVHSRSPLGGSGKPVRALPLPSPSPLCLPRRILRLGAVQLDLRAVSVTFGIAALNARLEAVSAGLLLSTRGCQIACLLDLGSQL